MFIFCLLFVYYFDYITVQYYTADCISWVPRLILLDFGTNWTYQCSLGIELICMWGTYCIVGDSCLHLQRAVIPRCVPLCLYRWLFLVLRRYKYSIFGAEDYIP